MGNSITSARALAAVNTYCDSLKHNLTQWSMPVFRNVWLSGDLNFFFRQTNSFIYFFDSTNSLLQSQFSLVRVWYFRWPSGGAATRSGSKLLQNPIICDSCNEKRWRPCVLLKYQRGIWEALFCAWGEHKNIHTFFVFFFLLKKKEKPAPTHLFFDGWTHEKSCWLWSGKFCLSCWVKVKKKERKKESQLNVPEAGKSWRFYDVSKYARISHLTRRLHLLFALEMNLRSSFKTVKCPFFIQQNTILCHSSTKVKIELPSEKKTGTFYICH